MSREHTDHPAFPVAAYAGDETNPIVRPNSGMGMLKYVYCNVWPAIFTANKNEEPEAIAELAMAHVHAILEEWQYLNRK